MAEINTIVSIDELYGIYRENSPDELIIDLRSPEDYRLTHIENSVSLPVIKVSKSSLDLKTKKSVYLFCKDGKDAPRVADLFARIYSGVKVYHVTTGGFDEWVQKKYPVVSGLAEVSPIRKENELDPNEPDGRNIVKKTRLLPDSVREEAAALLPEGIRIYYFTDRSRCCYLLCDLTTKSAIVINPLVEIHHHLIDQVVRMDCDLSAVIYFDGISFQNSPPPETHARDFAKLCFSKAYAADGVGSLPSPWKDRLASATQDGSLRLGGIAFSPKTGTIEAAVLTLSAFV